MLGIFAPAPCCVTVELWALCVKKERMKGGEVNMGLQKRIERDQNGQ